MKLRLPPRFPQPLHSPLNILLVLGVVAVLAGGHLSAQSPASYYDTAKQRLLAIGAAQFITNVTQGEIGPDSAQLFACRIYGLGRLLPYNEDFPKANSTEGSRMIESGNIAGATRLEPTLAGMDRLRISLDLGAFYLFKPGKEKPNLDSALFYIQQAVRFGQFSGLQRGLNPALNLLGKYYFQTGTPAMGAASFARVVKACEQQQDQQELALAFENAGQYLPFTDSNRTAYLRKSLTLYQQLGNKEKQIEVSSDIITGLFWTDWASAAKELKTLLSLQESIGYRHNHFVLYVTAYLAGAKGNRMADMDLSSKALASMQSTGDSTFYPLAYLRMADVNAESDRMEQSVAMCRKGLSGRLSRETQPFWYFDFVGLYTQLIELNRLEEASGLLSYFADRYPPATPLQNLYLAECKASYYWKVGQLALAHDCFQQFADMADHFPAQYIDAKIPGGYLNYAEFETREDRFDQARLYLGKASMIAPSQLNLFDKMKIALVQFRVDSAAHNKTAAIDDFIRYHSLYDSETSISEHNHLEELSVQYETEKKDRNIQFLTQRGKLQQTEIYQAHFIRNLLIAGACLLFVILALLFYQYRIKQTTNRIITEKNHSMEQLLGEKEELIADKETLVKEIHHRVKNNLHLISSLLESQSAYLQDEALFAIQKSQHRVQAISLIHQKLYLNDQVTDVGMSVYLREIISYLRDSFVTDENITFNLDLDPVQLDVSQAVPLGLIVNEAVTNAVKYAFPQNKTGNIDIALKQGPAGECRLRIADNGVGLPKDHDTGQTKSLGMSLIKGLSRTLQADLHIRSASGTTIELTFIDVHAMATIE
jgi:two-component system, sensor histidine kinase PdtaS